MLRAEYTTQFKKDLKLAQRRRLDIERLKAVVSKLCCSGIFWGLSPNFF